MEEPEKLTRAVRSLRLLKILAESPFIFTKAQLAEKLNVARDTIKDSFEDIKTAGYNLTPDPKHRYGFEADKPLEYLKAVFMFTESEQKYLNEVMRSVVIRDTKFQRLQQKLSVMYDMSKVSNSLIDKQFLTKLNILNQAHKLKKVIRLIDYPSSNSNTEETRLVEAFHISPKDDMIQVYDLERKDMRHFRISRIEGLEITSDVWQFEKIHKEEKTDPFRIVEDNQVDIHIRVKVAGFNELVERFPLTRQFLKRTPDIPNHYDLVCKVNYKFYGIANFIRGYSHAVTDIIEPEILIEHINELNRTNNF